MSRFVRFYYVLLALMLVLPSLQAHAHAPVATSETTHHMHMQSMAGHEMPQHHTPAPTVHDCLGCIAPLDIAVYRPASLARKIAWRDARPIDSDLLLTRSTAPEPPPPRAAV